MSVILYALVTSAEGVTLAEAYASSGTHVEKAKKVLTGLKTPVVERRCLAYNGYSYDILPHKDGTVYMCVTRESCNPAVSFKFLEAVRTRCSANRTNLITLASELRTELELFNDAQNTKIREIRSEVEAVKGEMAHNMDRLMYRSDKLDALLLKSSELEEGSSAFRQTAGNAKRKLIWKRIMICIIVSIIVIALLFTAILLICSKDGMNFHRCNAA